jgi:hypothetical protein
MKLSGGHRSASKKTSKKSAFLSSSVASIHSKDVDGPFLRQALLVPIGSHLLVTQNSGIYAQKSEVLAT